MTTTQNGISQKFWTEFTSKIWEKEELALKDSFIRIPISSDDLFNLLVNEFNTADDVHGRTDFFIGFKNQKIKKADILLPRKEDKSFTNYNERIRSLLNGQNYTLILDCIRVNDTLWDWTYEFLQSLYTELGYLSYGHFYSVFYGNYQVTPSSVHIDREGAFYFPIVGGKSMRIWTREFADQHPKLKGAKNYQDFLEDSTLLQCQAGGMIYWRSNRWHVGDSKGGDVSIALAVNPDGPILHVLLEVLYQEIKNLYGDSIKGFFWKKITRALMGWNEAVETIKLLSGDDYKNYPSSPIIRGSIYLLSLMFSIVPSQKITGKCFFNPNDLQESAEQIPEPIRLAAKELKWLKWFIGSRIIERASIKLWLTMLTSYGFFPLSAPQIVSDKIEILKSDDYIQIYPRRVILYRIDDEYETFTFVNGIGISVSQHPIFPILIRKINSGEVQSVAEILEFSRTVIAESNSKNCQIEDVCKFLDSLLLYRGIKIIK
jgi:hypothetical protein